MPIRNAWTKLGSTADEPVAGLLVLRLCPESKLDVFAAIEPHSDHRLLLLKSKVPPLRRLENLPEGPWQICVKKLDGEEMDFVQMTKEGSNLLPDWHASE